MCRIRSRHRSKRPGLGSMHWRGWRPSTLWLQRSWMRKGSRCHAGGRLHTLCSACRTAAAQRHSTTLLGTPGRYTASFAAKGLANMPPANAVSALRQIIEQRRAHPMVVVQAMRALAASGTASVAPALIRILGDSSVDPTTRMEAMTAFGAVAGPSHLGVLLDLLSDPVPSVRAGAMRALARVDGDSFILALAGLDPDADWTVRVAQAQALGTLPSDRGFPRLRAMLTDADHRVVPAVLGAGGRVEGSGRRADPGRPPEGRRFRRALGCRHGPRRTQRGASRAGARRGIPIREGRDDLRCQGRCLVGAEPRRSPVGAASAGGGAQGSRLGGAGSRCRAPEGAGRDDIDRGHDAAGHAGPAR